jgi:hypothetical protein
VASTPERDTLQARLNEEFNTCAFRLAGTSAYWTEAVPGNPELAICLAQGEGVHRSAAVAAMIHLGMICRRFRNRRSPSHSPCDTPISPSFPPSVGARFFPRQVLLTKKERLRGAPFVPWISPCFAPGSGSERVEPFASVEGHAFLVVAVAHAGTCSDSFDSSVVPEATGSIPQRVFSAGVSLSWPPLPRCQVSSIHLRPVGMAVATCPSAR